MRTTPLTAAFLVASHIPVGNAECWRDTTCDGPKVQSFPGEWDSNNIAPDTRTLQPVRVLDADHNYVSPWPPSQALTLQQNGTLLIFDWAYEVGGVVTIDFQARGEGKLGIAFTEASNFTGYISDNSNGGTGPDGALYSNVDTSGSTDFVQQKYVVPDDRARGGFRYLSLYTLSNSSLEISIDSMTVELSFHPNWGNMRAYGGYFHSSDSLLNRIWYSGAYSIQTNIMATNTARVYPCLNTGWENNADLGTDGPGLAAGNKRDRAVWAGDFGMAIRSAAIALGDMGTLRRSLQLQYDVQQSTGELPWVPPPINIFGSDTYHMATLIATRDYVLFSGDTDWLKSYWEKYKLGVSFVTSKIDGTRLMDVTGANNWGRTAVSSGYTTDGNMLLYGALTTGATMAEWMNDPVGADWTQLAEGIKSAIIENTWDESVGAFWNTLTDHSNHCEDGNSMAMYYGGVDSSYANKISDFLTTAWTDIGAETGELPGSVVMYVEGFEVKGHLQIGQAKRALDLIRRSWGWNLQNPFGTESTFVEGYKVDGSWRYRDDSYSMNGTYTAHSLGWSTGPTDALVSYIVGLQPTSPGGQNWTLQPQFGDLSFAEGGFTLPTGKFSSSWNLQDNRADIVIGTPINTSGIVTLPLMNGTTPQSVKLDYQEVPINSITNTSPIVIQCSGGQHSLILEYYKEREAHVVYTSTILGVVGQEVWVALGRVGILHTRVAHICRRWSRLIAIKLWSNL